MSICLNLVRLAHLFIMGSLLVSRDQFLLDGRFKLLHRGEVQIGHVIALSNILIKYLLLLRVVFLSAFHSIGKSWL